MPPPPTPPPDRDARRLDHLGRQYLVLHEDFQGRALAWLHERGHHGLTPALVALIPHIRADGSRATDIAQRMHITKQAVGKLVDELIRLGYLERVADPSDRRAWLVLFTRAGDRLLDDVVAFIDLTEERATEVLGPRRFAQLRALLQELVVAAEADRSER